jgi:hypothetical protein
MSDTEHKPVRRVWIWFADNGNIRKWQAEPFPEGTEYCLASEAEAAFDEMTRSCLAERSEAAALRKQVSDAVGALEPFVFGDSDIANILWGELPDNATMKTTAPLGAYRRARSTLATLTGGKADD